MASERLLRILVVEDEFLIALELQELITGLGHVCVGPAATLAEGLALCADAVALDAAILNVKVAGDYIDPVCEILTRRGVPFGFATGASGNGEHDRWRGRPRIVKPYMAGDLAVLLQQLIGRAD